MILQMVYCLGVSVSLGSATWLAAMLFLIASFFLFPFTKEMANKIIWYTFMALVKPWVEVGRLADPAQALHTSCQENQTS